MDVEAVIEHLRTACSEYAFEPMAIYKKHGIQDWPVHAENPDDLARKLESGGHFLALPREPAALANIVEVALVDFLIERLDSPDFRLSRGTERGYPDVELEVDGEYFAIDVKVAKRKVSKKGIPTGKTQSRITLYTGNTFFLYPTLKWPGILRPFDDYSGHIDLIGLYTLDLHSPKRVSDFELIVSEAWRIASKHRSSLPAAGGTVTLNIWVRSMKSTGCVLATGTSIALMPSIGIGVSILGRLGKSFSNSFRSSFRKSNFRSP